MSMEEAMEEIPPLPANDEETPPLAEEEAWSDDSLTTLSITPPPNVYLTKCEKLVIDDNFYPILCAMGSFTFCVVIIVVVLFWDTLVH